MYDTIQKTIIAWIFNHVAHYYFDNINITQLKFDKGELELRNLALKRTALQHLKVPWNVVSGEVQILKVYIPGLTLLTDPCVIKLENLVIVVSPRTDDTCNGSAHDRKSHDEEPDANDPNNITSSEEARLAEFYRSFTNTVSSTFKEIYGNIRVEIESLCLSFEGFRNNVAKLCADRVVLYRPESNRKLDLQKVSIYMSHNWAKRDLMKYCIENCNLEVHDVSGEGEQTSLEIISETDIHGDLVIIGTPTLPIAKFLLEDFRMLYFSLEKQQDVSIFARLSCSHFNRENASWDTCLEPWPFNLSWDKRVNHRRTSLTSDETAEVTMSSSLIDLIDVMMRRFLSESSNPRPLLVAKTPQPSSHIEGQPIFMVASSPQDAKLIYYNNNTNLARQIGGRSTRKLFIDRPHPEITEIDLYCPMIKMTLLDNLREKIVDIIVESISFKCKTKAKEQIVDLSIRDIKINNAMDECEESIVLDRAAMSPNDTTRTSPAIRLFMDRILGRNFGTLWFKQLQITVCELVMNIEEKLFLKLIEFISFRNREPRRGPSDPSRDLRRNNNPGLNQLPKYYFDLLRIDLSGLKLSVYTASSLPYSLQELKSCLGLSFFGFEDAQVKLAPYFRMNVSRTLGGIYESVTRFYKRQISDQAPRIVGQQIHNYLIFHLPNLLSCLYDEVHKLFF